MQAAMDARAQYTVELRTLHAGSGEWRWTVSRGRVLVDADGEPVRILGTVLDVTEARRDAEARLAAFHRATAIAEVAAELANAASFEQLPEIVQRGAQVLGAQSSALAIFDADGGPLRLHMTNRLTDEIQVHVDYRVAGVEIELDDTQPTQYAAMHGRRVLLADREEALARFPATREGLDVLGIHAIAALPLRVEGRVLGAFVPLWSTPHPFAADDVEVLEALAAQIALSVSRLQADAERATAVTAMTEANQRLQLLAEAGRILSGTLEIDQQVAGARRARRPRARRLVLARRHRRAGPAARDRHRAPRPLAATRRSRPTCAPWSSVMTDDAGARVVTEHRPSGGHARGQLGPRRAGAPRPRAPARRSPGSGVGSGGRRPAGGAGPDPRRPRACSTATNGSRSARPRSTPPSRSGSGPAWPCTTPGSSASSATSPTPCSAACSPTRRSRTTRRSSSATVPGRAPAPRSAATGTTPSCSPTAPR